MITKQITSAVISPPVLDLPRHRCSWQSVADDALVVVKSSYSYHISRFDGHIAVVTYVRNTCRRSRTAAGARVVEVIDRRRLDTVVVPQSSHDVGHDQVCRVLGEQLEDEDAVLSQVALGETTRHLAVALDTRRAVRSQPGHDLQILTDVTPTTTLRQQDPRPAHQAEGGERREDGQPVPQHQINLLAEEVDGQDALDGVWVDVAHVAAYAEVAERDAWKDGSGDVPLAAGDDLEDGVDAEEMVAAAEEVIEQVELADDVQ